MNNKQILKLVRKTLLNYPELGEVLKEEVPLGKEYYILDFAPECEMHNKDTNKIIVIDCYYVQDVSFSQPPGLLAVDFFGD